MTARQTVLFFLCTALALGQETPEFDEKRAFGYLEAQCNLGPRVPGTAGHRKGLRHILETVTPLADTVLQQSFSHSWADQDRNPKNRSKPVLGANDGASGVAVLMELAHQLGKQPPPIGVDLVFIDGEDMGKSGQLARFFNGSRYLARNIPSPPPEYCILIDMVGDSDLQLPVEGNSLEQAPDLVDRLWGEAEQLGLAAFSRETAYWVDDDHVVLYEVGGIPSVDIIDFDYGPGRKNYWHTVEDTPDKCSPQSLDVVGTLLLHHIYGRK